MCCIIYTKRRVLIFSSNMYSTVLLSIYKYSLSAAPEHFQWNAIFSWHSRTISHPKSTSRSAVCNSGKFWHVAICVGLNAVLKIKQCCTQQGLLIAISQLPASAEYDKSLPRETDSHKKKRCLVVFRWSPLNTQLLLTSHASPRRWQLRKTDEGKNYWRKLYKCIP
jgi:hypothetical protein